MLREEKSPIEIGKAPIETKRVRFEKEMPQEDHGRPPNKMEQPLIRVNELSTVVVSTKNGVGSSEKR